MTMTETVPVRGTTPTTVGIGEASLLIAGRTLRQFLRSPMLIVSTFGFPLVQLFVLLAAFSALVADTTQEQYVQRLAPFIMLTTAFLGLGSVAISFWLDVHSGMFGRLRTMPISVNSILVGRVLGDSARVLIVAVATALIAYVPGFRFSEGPLAVIGFFGTVMLFGVMCTVIALAAALKASDPGALMRKLQLPSLVFFFLSSGYLPLEAFPEVVRPLINANPLSIANKALIGLSSGGPVLVSVLQLLAWTVVITGLCSVAMTRRFRGLVTT